MYNSLLHSKWDCKYHLIFIPKRRKSALYNELRVHLRKVFHDLAWQKECQIIEGHLRPDHVHMCIQIPPKYAVSSIVGFLKGKSAIRLAHRRHTFYFYHQSLLVNLKTSTTMMHDSHSYSEMHVTLLTLLHNFCGTRVVTSNFIY
jgi:REP element-mobilizing transposase RayT